MPKIINSRMQKIKQLASIRLIHRKHKEVNKEHLHQQTKVAVLRTTLGEAFQGRPSVHLSRDSPVIKCYLMNGNEQ